MSDDEDYDDIEDEEEDITETEDAPSEDETEETETEYSVTDHGEFDSKTCISTPVATQYEIASIIGRLASMIENGYDPKQPIPKHLVRSYDIAKYLVSEKKFAPFDIIRPVRGDKKEIVSAKDLIIL